MSTVYDLEIAEGTHDVVYDGDDFRSTGATQAAVTMRHACWNITFRNCTFQSTYWNGVSINDINGAIHDVLFEDCTFLSCGRMGFECTNRGEWSDELGESLPPTAIYQHIDLVGCTFEPQGNEGISFDGGHGFEAHCLIYGVTIQAAGNDPAQPYAHGFEINGPHAMTVTELTIYRTRGSMLNLTGYSDEGAGACGWTFTDCVFDFSVDYLTPDVDAASRCIIAFGVDDALFTRCTFNPDVVAFKNGWIEACHDNDFRTCTVLGSGGKELFSQVSGSSGNMFPAHSGTITFYANSNHDDIRAAAATWEEARTTGGTLTVAPYSHAWLGLSVGSGFKCYEQLLEVDTSSLPDLATIDSAVVSINVKTNNALAGSVYELRAADDFYPTVEAGEWVNGDDLDDHTLLATITPYGMGTGLLTMTSQPALLSYLDKTGYTPMVLCIAKQRSSSVPTVTDQLEIYRAGEGGSYRPTFVVAYTEVSDERYTPSGNQCAGIASSLVVKVGGTDFAVVA